MSFKVINDEDDQQQREIEPTPVSPAAVPYYTYLMTAGIVAVFLVQMQSGLDKSFILGVFDKQAFLHYGEFWRLFTACVMHASVAHIFFNAYALYSFGKLFEVLSNRAHIAIIFWISALSGAFVSLVLNPQVASIGASGGIIGLLGYVAVYSIKRKQFLEPAFRKNIFINVGLLALIGIVMYQTIDNFAHLGGIVAGAVYGWLQIPSDPNIDPREVSAITEGIGLVALCLYLFVCLLTALYLLGII